jgi:hypothetical protein
MPKQGLSLLLSQEEHCDCRWGPGMEVEEDRAHIHKVRLASLGLDEGPGCQRRCGGQLAIQAGEGLDLESGWPSHVPGTHTPTSACGRGRGRGDHVESGPQALWLSLLPPLCSLPTGERSPTCPCAWVSVASVCWALGCPLRIIHVPLRILRGWNWVSNSPSA